MTKFTDVAGGQASTEEWQEWLAKVREAEDQGLMGEKLLAALKERGLLEPRTLH